MRKELVLSTLLVLIAVGPSFAAHPLITDDTGTQGKGKAQLEFIGEYGHEKEDGVTTKSLEVPTIPVLSYGLTDTVDLVLGLSYRRIETKEGGVEATERGMSDASVEWKWRFYEKDGLSFALKPGVTLPTGDENKGLGNGRASYGMFFITTQNVEPWAFHLNIGYMHNEYKLQADEDANRKGIWHASLASEVEVLKGLKAVANIGMERNSDKMSDIPPTFILGGVIYSITENFDVDLGVKGGLNKPEMDYSFLAGIAWRF